MKEVPVKSCELSAVILRFFFPLAVLFVYDGKTDLKKGFSQRALKTKLELTALQM